MDEITGPIADYSASLRFEQLPEAIVTAALTCLVDALGCFLGGYDSPQAGIGRRLAEGAAPSQYAGRVLGTTGHSSAEMATFANSAAIRYLDFNDTYPGGHPSDCLGALLALAEHARADGPRLLTSLVVAYETFARLISATRQREGWSQGFTTGIATVAGLGSLLQLPREGIGHALAICAVSNVALGVTITGEISQWKGAATAFAARNAVFATVLAAGGTTGPEAPFSGRHGVWEQVTGQFALSPFATDNRSFLLPRVRLKYWPVQYEAQLAVWAAVELRERLPSSELRSVELVIAPSAWRDQGPEMWDPQTRETADHSVPYVFARALRDGTINRRSFEEQAVRDASLRSLMGKIRLHRGTEARVSDRDALEMRVLATAKGGERHELSVANPVGHERNPMAREQVSAKFSAQATPMLGDQGAQAALDAWWNVEKSAEIGPLLAALGIDGALA